ncbi:uncharacterized protein LOC131177991 [Hevea brasiliensis]|uniref:uncharacterized protein LOC131177991 n=1 Tax=Hevea brasiliensis TaxID=3981 RepID=UPI0025DC42B0|nr:uncharacterized protein LOC131177991 [Hevea brasiliensis]
MVKVRAAWQRTTNHCFVQEDAKRAPKLACCQSSSSSSKQVDGGPTSATNILDNSAIDFLLCTGTLHILTYPLIQDGGFNCNLVMGTKKKSLDYIGNCDLLPPQKVHVRRYPYGHPRFFDHDDTIPSSLDWKAQNGGIHMAILVLKPLMEDKELQLEGTYKMMYDSIQQKLENFLRAIYQKLSSWKQFFVLKHESRKLRRNAKQAFVEKEHINKLFLSQNSQLFAYKEWFEMLQLEILYYQVKNGEKPISTLFLVVLPRIPLKGRNLQKSWQKFTRGKHGRPSHDISKYVVAFALGLSIVGASLLLGWVLPL